MTEATPPASQSRQGKIRDLAVRYVPIVRWLPGYQRADLVPDTTASLTSWAVMVPVALAYASLAGLPPEIGLVTAFAALAAYALFGTSRQLKVTTSSTMAVMSLAIVTPLAGGEASRFVALSATLALLVGATLVIAGLLRLGFISEFLAKPVVTGFIIGVALTVMVGQLPKILGVPAASGSVPDQVVALAAEIEETDPMTMALGLGTVLLMILLRRFAPRLPGGLIAVVLGIILVETLGLDDKGVAVVGPIQTGWPGIGLPAVGLSDLTYLLTGALGLVFLIVGESVSTARAIALRHRQEIDPDQELVALGASNTAAGLLGGFAVDASLSQSAASDEAGARTQLASLLTAGLVLLTLLLLAPLFESLPMATLGAVVIVAVASLIDLGELQRYWQQRRTDALLASAALIGVVTTDVLAGLIIAVLLSLLLVLYRASRPYLAVLGRLPGDKEVYADLSRHSDAHALPGLLLLRIDAPLYFFNVTVARSQILDLIRRQTPAPSVVIVDLGATADLDVTTSDMLAQLITELDERGISLSIAQAKGAVRDRLRRTGLMERLGRDHLYFSMAQAVANESEHLAGPSGRADREG